MSWIAVRCDQFIRCVPIQRKQLNRCDANTTGFGRVSLLLPRSLPHTVSILALNLVDRSIRVERETDGGLNVLISGIAVRASGRRRIFRNGSRWCSFWRSRIGSRWWIDGWLIIPGTTRRQRQLGKG